MTEKKDPTATKLRNLISECAICALNLEGHSYVELATTVIDVGLKDRMAEFLSRVRQHEWEKLTEFNDFQGDRDDLVAYAITGPHSDGMVIVIRDPFDLYEGPEMLIRDTLVAAEIASICTVLPSDAWKQL